MEDALRKFLGIVITAGLLVVGRAYSDTSTVSAYEGSFKRAGKTLNVRVFQSAGSALPVAQILAGEEIQAVCQAVRGDESSLDLTCSSAKLNLLSSHVYLSFAREIRFGSWLSGYETYKLRPVLALAASR